MKRFIVSVLCAAVFFTGLGGLLEKAAANLKSDERALEVIRRARQAIGGDANINNVRSMTITGKVTKTFDTEGAARTDSGDAEISFELPNRMSKMIKIGNGDGEKIVDKKVDVIVMRKGDGDDVQFKTDSGDVMKKVIVKKADGSTEEIKSDDKQPIIVKKGDGDMISKSADGKTATIDKKIVRRSSDGEFPRSNELFRTTFSLLLTAPEGLSASFSYVGEESVDGALCNVIAANDGGSTFKLYVDKQTNLPRMMSYQAPRPLLVKMTKDAPDTDVKVFSAKLDAPEMADFQVKFSDFRTVGGLQLPHRWTQTVGGKADETIDITGYEINPANIADKFKDVPTKVLVRMKKEQ